MSHHNHLYKMGTYDLVITYYPRLREVAASSRDDIFATCIL